MPQEVVQRRGYFVAEGWRRVARGYFFLEGWHRFGALQAQAQQDAAITSPSATFKDLISTIQSLLCTTSLY